MNNSFNAMQGDYTGELFILGGIALTAILGWIGSIIAKRIKARASEPEMWRRLDELSLEVYGGRDAAGKELPGLKARLESAERRDAAKAYIIRQLVRQWPSEDPPKLDPGYLSELDEDTLPLDHPWRF